MLFAYRVVLLLAVVMVLRPCVRVIVCGPTVAVVIVVPSVRVCRTADVKRGSPAYAGFG